MHDIQMKFRSIEKKRRSVAELNRSIELIKTKSPKLFSEGLLIEQFEYGSNNQLPSSSKMIYESLEPR